MLASTPTPPTPHQKNTTPIQRYLPPYPILLLYSLYFCGIRQYFVHILIMLAHVGATASNMLSNKTIFFTYPHCVSSWISYSLKHNFPWNCFASICLYQFNVFLFIKTINMFRIGITPPQPLFFLSLIFVLFLSIIIIIIMYHWKRYFGGGISTLKMFMILMNRKT